MEIYIIGINVSARQKDWRNITYKSELTRHDSWRVNSPRLGGAH